MLLIENYGESVQMSLAIYFYVLPQAQMKLVSKSTFGMTEEMGESWFKALHSEFSKPYFIQVKISDMNGKLAFTFMASLCGVRVCVNNFSKSTKPRDLLFILKILDLLRMKNCSRNADIFVHLFPSSVHSRVGAT